jgi:hypothetical protein
MLDCPTSYVACAQAAGVDPTCPEVPDGIQKSAEQVVRQAINEVHGPFFNEEVGEAPK